MVSIQSVRKMALSFLGVEEKPHFEVASFRNKNRIFATLWEKDHKVMLKLSLVSQSVYCSYNASIFFSVPGGWGKQGATFVDLKKVESKIFKEALSTAYDESIKPAKKAKKIDTKRPNYTELVIPA